MHIDFAISQSLVYLLDDGIVRKDDQVLGLRLGSGLGFRAGV